jgi:hypothetical protein
MSKGISNEVVPQWNKPNEKVRLFHGSPNKIEDGKINPSYVSAERLGFDEGGINAAFASSDIHQAARYAGPEGHIYEINEKPDDLDNSYSQYAHDNVRSEGIPLTIKQEVGHPGRNIARRMARSHFDTGHGESRK